MKSNRIKAIEDYIIDKERASIEELCSIFQVSINTMRRDITELEKKGRIKKVYGGIILNDKKTTEPFELRKVKNYNSKQIIAKLASQLVEDGDIIFIDSGTTTLHMIEHLTEVKNLTIITNNFNLMLGALALPNINIVSTGGTLFKRTNSFVGLETVNSLKNYNFSKAFMATTGFSIARGVTNSSSFEYEIKKYIVANCENVILLADSSKLERASLITYYPLEDIDILITDKMPTTEYLDFFDLNHVKLITP